MLCGVGVDEVVDNGDFSVDDSLGDGFMIVNIEDKGLRTIQFLYSISLVL